MSDTCPVCRCIFVRPRVYPTCGHSVCSHCMRDCDRYTDRQFVHSAILYKCPVCRETTVLPWHHRPRNLSLQAMCEDLPGYANREAELGPEIGVPALETFDEKTDLARLSRAKQEALVIRLYEEVMPCLFEAAQEGRTHITVDDQRVVLDMHRCAEAFSNHLFEKHNVYRIMLTTTDATFHFSRQSIRIRNDFVNGLWHSPQSVEDDDSSSLASSSNFTSASTDPPSIFSRITTMLDAVERNSREALLSPLPPPPAPPGLDIQS